MSSFYSEEELKSVGLKEYGENVWISRNAMIYGAENMSLGNNVRIDDFCVLSGKIRIENNVHIAPFCLLAGGSVGIIMKDFSGLSSRVSIYAVSDDYSGSSLTNPTIDAKYKNIVAKEVILGRHVIIGASSVVLPGTIIGEGASVGSMSLVTKSIDSWTVNVGVPCKTIKERSRQLLHEEKKYLSDKE